MEYVIIYVIGSIVTFCAIYPAYFAYFQREYPKSADAKYASDMLDAFLFAGALAIFWPIGLPVWLIFVVCRAKGGDSPYKHGLKWR